MDESMARLNSDLISTSEYERLTQIEGSLQETISSLESRLTAILTPLTDDRVVEAIPKERSPFALLVDNVTHANVRLLRLLERIEL